jgi:signal transduction histidine kinase/ligand-binding sensor domain-containing protein
VKAIPLLLLGILFASTGRSSQPNSELTLQQLNHRAFAETDGAPGDIYALAQTTDGTLWIGGRAGLTRFDGLHFVTYPGPADEPLQSTNIAGLLATPDGGLWIAFRLGGVSFLKGGHVTRYGEHEGFPESSVEQFALDRDGSLWAAARLGLVHFKDGRWETVAAEGTLGTPYAVLVDRAGTLWVGTTNGLFARLFGENRFRAVNRRVSFGSGGTSLVAAPDGRIWAAPSHELIRIDRPTEDGVVTVGEISGGPLLFDDAGSLWAAEMDTNTLLRVPSRELAGAGRQQSIHPEKFSRVDGLSAGRVSAFLEDREHNIWVSTAAGLDRFNQSNFVRNATRPCYQRLSATGAFAPGDNGVLWIACNDGSNTYVEEILDGALLSRQSTPPFSVTYRDTQGNVWFAGPTALGHLENGRVVATPLALPVRGRPIQALVRDDKGAIWFSVSRRSLFRFFDGEWSEYGNLDTLPRGYPLAETADGEGALWFGYSNNRIARVKGGRVELFDTRQGVEVGNVTAFAVQDREVWVGGELGLARLDGERFVSVFSASATPFKGVSGIVLPRNGDLWLNGIGGITHIAREELGRVVRDPTHRVVCETFNYLDGVSGTASQLRPLPSAVETTDGRMWFSTTRGIISIDATHLVRNTLPPPVTIWSLTSGPRRYPNRGTRLHLPVHTTDLEIEYTAGALTVPERVRFRYKLEGSDRDWQEVGSRREALYTNLSPGRFTFRVTASNNDGVWSNEGASIDFMIAPAFYQTTWFYVLCGLACVALLAALYRMRMRQVAAQVRGRLEARLAERERIARELHDTLLQGMQGLIWRFQAATDRIPSDEPARRLMEQSLDRADKLLAEGRDRVKDLRPTVVDVADLAQALAAEGEQFGQLHPAQFRVSVQGAPRDLHPMVREEGFIIAREALGNAFRHSGAKDIEAEVTYGDAALQVRVRDDGRGIGTTVLDAGGKAGHFGLVGMRERAKNLGGHLEVWSKPGAGTEIDLQVPADVAYRYAQVRSRYMLWRLAAFRSSTGPTP